MGLNVNEIAFLEPLGMLVSLSELNLKLFQILDAVVLVSAGYERVDSHVPRVRGFGYTRYAAHQNKCKMGVVLSHVQGFSICALAQYRKLDLKQQSCQSMELCGQWRT